MRSLLSAYSRASIAAPLSTAFATCLAKGSASDAIAQVQVEKAEKIDGTGASSPRGISSENSSSGSLHTAMRGQ